MKLRGARAPRNFVFKRNMSLTNSILEGNRLALARLLTQVENDSPEGRGRACRTLSAYRQGTSHRRDRRAGHGEIFARQSAGSALSQDMPIKKSPLLQ